VKPRVELIYDADCPNVDEARRELTAALQAESLPVHWEERIQGNPGPEEEVLGSPTITVDGRDVAPEGPQRRTVGASCRIYVDGNRMRGSPSRETIRAALRESSDRGGGAAPLGVASAATGAGAAFVSVVASACCVGPVMGPLLVTILGAGGAAWAASLKPFSGWLLAFAGVMLALGFYGSYRSRRSCSGGPPRRRDQLVRGVLWLSAALWLISLTLNLALP
jgi:hypothetical protein